MSYKNRRVLTLQKQYTSICATYPDFNATLFRSKLIVYGNIKPTARSEIYSFRLRYSLPNHLDIIITNPKLKPNFKGERVPHVYSGMKLCLYQPNYKEFTPSQYLSRTVFGWISLWLYFYEIWHITGDWLGGGEHPD